MDLEVRDRVMIRIRILELRSERCEIMILGASRAKLQATASGRSMIPIIPSYPVSWRLSASHCSLHLDTNCYHNLLVPPLTEV